uniref:Uncharacterized protein n=1 Tax=Toxoplasma gondii TgCATBr9 TaxID=943120 RepID=A0A2T6IK72_TOXGO|nr:hypothetical protein TGBR9_304520 [Toxoplasma gondii TgCATBr9]
MENETQNVDPPPDKEAASGASSVEKTEAAELSPEQESEEPPGVGGPGFSQEADATPSNPVRRESSILKTRDSSLGEKALNKGVSWGESVDDSPESDARPAASPLEKAASKADEARKTKVTVPRLQLKTNQTDMSGENGEAAADSSRASFPGIAHGGSLASLGSATSSVHASAESAQQILSSAFHTVYRHSSHASRFASRSRGSHTRMLVRADMVPEHPDSEEVYGFASRSSRESREERPPLRSLFASRAVRSGSYNAVSNPPTEVTHSASAPSAAFRCLSVASSLAETPRSALFGSRHASSKGTPSEQGERRHRHFASGSQDGGKLTSNASLDSLSPREAPHALAADLLDASRAAAAMDSAGGLRQMASKRKPQSKSSFRSAPSRGCLLSEELQRSYTRHENDIFSEILEKLEEKKGRGSAEDQVYEHLPRTHKKRDGSPLASRDARRSEGMTCLGIKALNVEIVDSAVDPEWAFQQFSGKKIDAGARFDDHLDRLVDTPEEVTLHGYFPFQKESAKSRYERLITEVPHALVAVKEYFSNVDTLEKIHKQEEQLPEESRASFLLRLNGMLEDQGAALTCMVKNYVATDVTLQNMLFGRTHFTPEGESVDVDLFDPYCPDDCVSLNAVASSVCSALSQQATAALAKPVPQIGGSGIPPPPVRIRDGMINDEVAVANLERRIAAIESRLDEVCEMVDGDGLLPCEDLTPEALARFKADSRDFATQLTCLHRLLSRTFSETVLNQLETRLQLMKRQLDEQEDFSRRREQQRARGKQRQREGGNTPVDYDDILADWKPEKLLEKLHESIKEFDAAAGRVDTVGGQLEAAFAAREPLVEFLQQMRKQEKQNEVLKASLGSTVEMLKSLNAARRIAKDSSVPAVLGFSGAEVTGGAGVKKATGLAANFARAQANVQLTRSAGLNEESWLRRPVKKEGSTEKDETQRGLSTRVSFESRERQVQRESSVNGAPSHENLHTRLSEERPVGSSPRETSQDQADIQTQFASEEETANNCLENQSDA